jgi:hypothetical protein
MQPSEREAMVFLTSIGDWQPAIGNNGVVRESARRHRAGLYDWRAAQSEAKPWLIDAHLRLELGLCGGFASADAGRRARHCPGG